MATFALLLFAIVTLFDSSSAPYVDFNGQAATGGCISAWSWFTRSTAPVSQLICYELQIGA
jgi:hypothetical protein